MSPMPRGGFLKQIPLTRGLFALVDDEDFDQLMINSWCAGTLGYATCKRNNKTVYMHKVIIQTSMEVDHINGNTLDNRKENLRPVTHADNCKNRKKSNYKKSSKYKGVNFDKRSNLWRARIALLGKVHELGYFKLEKDAALAYNKAALEIFGKHAWLNKIDEA